jgi:hypothetical protein
MGKKQPWNTALTPQIEPFFFAIISHSKRCLGGRRQKNSAQSRVQLGAPNDSASRWMRERCSGILASAAVICGERQFAATMQNFVTPVTKFCMCSSRGFLADLVLQGGLEAHTGRRMER